jgi:hypothetical protein
MNEAGCSVIPRFPLSSIDPAEPRLSWFVALVAIL